MESESPPKRFNTRVVAAVVAAGAVATALIAVLTLWDRIFVDPRDVADIVEVSLLQEESLLTFSQRGVAMDHALGPAPQAAPEKADPVRVQAVEAFMPGAVGPTDAPGAPSTETRPSTEPSRVSPPTVVPSRTPTPSKTAPSPPPSGTTPVESPSPSAGPEVSPSVPAALANPSEAFLEALSKQPSLSRYPPELIGPTPPSPPGAETVKVPWLLRTNVEKQQEGTANKRTLVDRPAEEAAALLAQSLARVQSVVLASSTGDEQYEDPQGYLISVRITLQGLENEPLLLTWSMSGAAIEGVWSADKVAYRIIATTGNDAGNVQLWVPKMKEPGAYQVNVWLQYEGATAIADIGPPLTIVVP
jgi:hypothetical protein